MRTSRWNGLEALFLAAAVAVCACSESGQDAPESDDPESDSGAVLEGGAADAGGGADGDGSATKPAYTGELGPWNVHGQMPADVTLAHVVVSGGWLFGANKTGNYTQRLWSAKLQPETASIGEWKDVTPGDALYDDKLRLVPNGLVTSVIDGTDGGTPSGRKVHLRIGADGTLSVHDLPALVGTPPGGILEDQGELWLASNADGSELHGLRWSEQGPVGGWSRIASGFGDQLIAESSQSWSTSYSLLHCNGYVVKTLIQTMKYAAPTATRCAHGCVTTYDFLQAVRIDGKSTSGFNESGSLPYRLGINAWAFCAEGYLMIFGGTGADDLDYYSELPYSATYHNDVIAASMEKVPLADDWFEASPELMGGPIGAYRGTIYTIRDKKIYGAAMKLAED